jgi:TolB-like protein/DNA-binding winged helix-turn-helix (wHTH) protein/Tfp pilus assembly protein PilF
VVEVKTDGFSGEYTIAGETNLVDDFALGEWLVSPALNQVSRNGNNTRVEPKSMQVLVFLAEHPGVVAKDQVLSAVWPDVFVSDDVLSGCISALRKALEDNARRPQIIETIPKSGYRLLLPVEPVRRNDAVPKEIPSTGVSWWSRILSHPVALIAGLAGLSVIMIAARGRMLSEKRIDSVAVLPFVNAGADSGRQYLSDGIAEQVVDDLSQLNTLRVMAWTTVSRYRQAQIDVRAVGRSLGVKSVLTGQVIREGDRVVLQTELVDVGTGVQIWGQRYERNISEIPELQQQISRDIVTNLRVRLAGAEQRRMLHSYNASPAAYELYLKGRFFWGRRTKLGLQQGIENFQGAIKADPNYALAYAGLADCYNLLDDWGETAPRDSFPKARSAAEKAISLDPSLAEAHASLAMVRESYDWDWVDAEQEFQLAIELNPNYPTAHQWYGLMLATLGRFPEADAEVRRAMQLDPLSPIINMAVAEVYATEGRYDESIEQYKKVIALDPALAGAYGNLAEVYRRKQMYGEALKAIQKNWMLQEDPAFATELGKAYSNGGYSAVTRRELNRTLEERKRGQYRDPVDIAKSYAELNQASDALRWLQAGYEEHSSGMQNLSDVSKFDSLGYNSQFQYWLNVLGLKPVMRTGNDARS